MNRQLINWLNGARRSHPVAIVLGSSINGLSYARSLGRRDIPTLVLDSKRLSGAFSRFAGFQLLPPVDRAPQAWFAILDHIGSALSEEPVVFPTADEYVVFLSTHADSLSDDFRFLIPSRTVIDRITNKRLQYAAASEAGVPIPKTEFPSSLLELQAVADRMEYPCILKPYRAHIGRQSIQGKKVVILESRQELLDTFETLEGSRADFMVQEIVPGGDTALYGYLGFWNDQGKEQFWLTKRKLRQHPPLFGDGSRQMTVEAPRVAELSRRLLTYLDYRGFVGVEFKQDHRDGVFRLMEINARTVSGNQMAISAGVDFPWLGYRHIGLGDLEQTESVNFRAEVDYVNEIWDLKAFLALRKKHNLGFLDWLQSVYQAEAKALWARDDPKPLIVEMMRGLRGAGRKIARKLVVGTNR